MYKAGRWLVLFFLLLNICGCWDYLDLEDQDLPIAASFDLLKNPDPGSNNYHKVLFTTLTPNLRTGKEGSVRIISNPSPVVAMAREGKAWAIIANYNPTMIQTAIYSEELARQGLGDVMDITLRTPRIKHTIFMAVADGRADELLKLKVGDDVDNTGMYLLYLLKTGSNRGFIISTTLHEFAVNWVTGGKNPILPIVKASQNNIAIIGTAIFDGSKMIAKIGKPETRSLILLRGLNSGGYIPYSIQQDEYIERGTVYVKNQRSVKVKREGENYSFLITIKLSGIVVEKTGNRSFIENKKALETVEKIISASVERDCQNFIKKMQNEFEVDCINISKYALAKWRHELQGITDQKLIPNASFQVKVEVDLENFGERR